MAILRGVSSRVLPCGCLAGIYETYGGDIVAIVDVHSTSCAEPSHEQGKIIPEARNRDAMSDPSRSARTSTSH